VASTQRARTHDVKAAPQAASKEPAPRKSAGSVGMATRLPSPAVAAAILAGAEQTERAHAKAPSRKPPTARAAQAPEVSTERLAVPAPAARPTAPAGPTARPPLAIVAKPAEPAARGAMPAIAPKTAAPSARAPSAPAEKLAAPGPAAATVAPVSEGGEKAPAGAPPSARTSSAEGAGDAAATPGAEAPKEPPAAGAASEAKADTKPGKGTSADKEDMSPGKEEGGAEAEGGAAAAPVKLHMPEPPSGPSRATTRRIRGVQARAGGAAAAKAALPTGDIQAGAARQAVDQPDAEAKAKAQAELMAILGEKAAPSPKIVELSARIRDVIRKKRPPDEDALMEAKPEGEALDAGSQLNSTVEEETKKVQGNYGALDTSPAGAAPAKGGELPGQPDAAATAAVNAKAAAPDPVPDDNVSLDADAEASKKKIQDAGMETPAAQLVQTGPVAEARGAQGELDQAAKEDPAKVLAGQKDALAKAEDDMAALQQQALTALTTSRAATTKGATSRQEGMVVSEADKRTKASADAQQIFTDAQKAVTDLLRPLASKAIDEWEAAKTLLVAQFKADLAPVQKRVEERHSGAGGFVVGLWDAVTGLPGWATAAYDKAELNFSEGVIAKITKISAEVNTVIATCELLIKTARDRIAKIFSDLGGSLDGWAAEQQAKFDGQLDTLRDQALATRDNFNKDLMERSSQAVDEVRVEIAELRKKAGGLLGRIANAISRFIDDPVKFIIEGLLELLGIPPAAFWAVVAKIKKVIKDIADDPLKFAGNLLQGLSEGFGKFFDNFGTHLLRGFLSWLLGDLKDVQVPKDVSVKSVVTFFLQLMGITWPNIRKILVKQIGAKNVALIEKVYSLVSLLIEKGPEGIYEMIKDKLDPQSIVDQVVSMAVDFMVSAIIKQVTARILLLFNPVGAIAQALEAIYRVLKWIFQNAAKIFTLIETVVNSIADILAGNTGGFAAAVEKALAMLIAPVIAFIADYLSLGDLPSIVAEKIKSMREWILGLIEKALVWIIEKGKALLAAVGIGKKKEEKAGEVDEGIGEKVSFSADGDPHTLWIEETASGIVVMVKTQAMPVERLLAQFEKSLGANSSKEAEAARELITKARGMLDHTEQEGNQEKQADEKAKAAPESKEASDDAEKEKQETVAKEQTLGDLLSDIFKLVHGGENILALLDKRIITRGAGIDPDEIADAGAVETIKAAKYQVYSQEKLGRTRYYIRRAEVPAESDDSKRPQVHFTERTDVDVGGALALGMGAGKAGADEKIEVYILLLECAGLSALDQEKFSNEDKYRREARAQIIKALVANGRDSLIDFMESSKVVPPSYNRLRGDIYDEYLVEAKVRQYTRPGPIFRKIDYPALHNDRQPDGHRGQRLYDAKGHGGLGPSGNELEQYQDYLEIISDPAKSKYNAIVYVILDHEARKKWEAQAPEAMFAP
jgi:hypothetical protein